MKSKCLVVCVLLLLFSGASVFGADANADETNLLPWGDFEKRVVGGKALPGGSWDGSTAVSSVDGVPWFPLYMYGSKEAEELFSKVRGQWLKVYFDSKGGGFGITYRDIATGDWGWLLGSNAYPTSKDTWTRLAVTFRYPDKDFKQPMFYFANGGNGNLFDNLRMYAVGTEPAQLLEPFAGVPNPDVKPLVEDGSFESSAAGMVPPSDWSLLSGGARMVEGQARTGRMAMLVLAESSVATGALQAEEGVALPVSLWVRGRGTVSLISRDLDSVGLPQQGSRMIRDFPVREKWLKIEVHSRSWRAGAAKRRIEIHSGKDSEVYVDDVSIQRDFKTFPAPEPVLNTFSGRFVSPNSRLDVYIGTRPISEVKGIEGATAIVIKATPANKGAPRISGGLTFQKGGAAPVDTNWRWTATQPPDDVGALAYDDSAWNMVRLDGNAMLPGQETGEKPVWFRRVVIWNVPAMLVPDLCRLPIAKGFAENLVYTLNPPTPSKPRSYDLMVEVPAAVRLVPIHGKYSGWWRTPQDPVEEGVSGGYRRYRVGHVPGDVWGRAGYVRNSAHSSLMMELDRDLPKDAEIRLVRLYNGNQVDLPMRIPLVQVEQPDGTRPKDMIINMQSWHTSYLNPPYPEFDVETVDRLMKLVVNAGFSDVPWPLKGGFPGADDPLYGKKWINWMKEKNIVLHPIWHHWPLMASHGRSTYEVVKKHPEAIAVRSKQKARGTDEPGTLYISTGWVMSGASGEYWEALRQEYANLRQSVRKMGLDLRGVCWDYEFEIYSYGGMGYDPLTLEMFRKWAKLSQGTKLDRQTIKKSHWGQYHSFSRWACRRMIQTTRERVFDPLGLKFHVYYGEGRPFDPGNCHIITSVGTNQNVPGLIPSVKREYDNVTPHIKRAPDILFLSLIQVEQMSMMRRRKTDDRELTANMIKRTVAVRGAGHVLYDELKPCPPGMYYGVAAAARFLAKWEDYFHDFKPIFAGKELDEIIQITPAPPDVVLLCRGDKGLALVFADAHEKQPGTVEFAVKPKFGKKVVLRLGPAEFGAVEIDLNEVSR